MLGHVFICKRSLHSWKLHQEISAAQAPPIPLNSDTICGMAVIFTFFAANHPIKEPIKSAPTINPMLLFLQKYVVQFVL